MYEGKNVLSSIPGGVRIKPRQPYVRDAAAPDHTWHRASETINEQRAQRLARVYHYLLIRAAENEAAEQQTQPASAVSTTDGSNEASVIPTA